MSRRRSPISSGVTSHGPDRVGAVEALALGRAQTTPRFDRLPVARGEVVVDRVAEDMPARFLGGNIGAGALGDDADFKLVVHDLAVARPGHRGAGSDDGEPVAEEVDRNLAIDRGDIFQRRRDRGLEGTAPARAQSLHRARPARRLPDVKRERHRVSQLSRLGQRRQEIDVRKRRPEIGLGASQFQQAPRRVDPGVIGVDEAQHRGERRAGGAVAARRGREVEDPAASRVNDANSNSAARAIGRQFQECRASTLVDRIEGYCSAEQLRGWVMGLRTACPSSQGGSQTTIRRQPS